MTDSLPIPYKGRYTRREFWAMLTKGSLWRKYCEANPVESANLQREVEDLISGGGDGLFPVNLTHTYTGNAIVMAILTMNNG